MRLILTAAILLAVGLPLAASATETIAYTYDGRGRLVKVVHSGNNAVQVVYQYDKAGNRVRMTTTGASH